jgi:hypothetical protein
MEGIWKRRKVGKKKKKRNSVKREKNRWLFKTLFSIK